MGVAKTPAWAHLLDEIAIRKDPVAWTTIGWLRLAPLEVLDGMQYLISHGYVERAGVVRENWQEILYRLSRKGRRYWEANVRGRRRRPPSASPLPKFSTAEIAAALSPRDVFDLARVPWFWDKRKEQLALGAQR